MTKLLTKKVRYLILLLVGLLLILFLPLPYYIELPGKAVPVSDYLTVTRPSPKKKAGELRLVYVSLYRASLATYLWSYTNRFASRIPAKEITGENNNSDYNKIQAYYMQDALNEAEYVALKAAHYQVKRKYQGIYVMSLLKNSTFKGKLQVGDVITAINSKTYQSSGEFVKAVQGLKYGSRVQVSYLRNQTSKVSWGRIVKLAGSNKTGLGISLADKSRIQTPVSFKTNVDDIGGPSAGLMFSLELYNQLTAKQLLRGRNVAGTGTISADGKVGPIGGIDKKVIASAKAKADIFFVPAQSEPGAISNYQLAKKTAKQIKTKMKIVPVASFSEAVTYLEEN